MNQEIIIRDIVKSVPGDEEIRKRFLNRLDEGKLTRDENPFSHFGVYFAPYDPGTQQVFIGHHKKSGLWLFNGGHLDQGETPDGALHREISEEWGNEPTLPDPLVPGLLTIAEIERRPNGRLCQRHFDIWYIFPVTSSTFRPDQTLLGAEFHETAWVTVKGARKLATDPTMQTALSVIESIIIQ